MVDRELTDRLHPDSSGKQLLFKLVITQTGIISGAYLGLGLMMFNIFIGHLGKRIKCTLMKLANDTKLSGEVVSSQGKAICRKTWIRWNSGLTRTL